MVKVSREYRNGLQKNFRIPACAQGNTKGDGGTETYKKERQSYEELNKKN
jgi:hypothetical protein